MLAGGELSWIDGPY